MNALQVTVSQLNTYIQARFQEDSRLSDVFVIGEISNFTDHYRSGHLYLSLKDDRSVIRAVMFSTYAKRLRFQPQDGMKVIAHGSVTVYPPNGQYQLVINDMQPDGLGALNLAYEQLKEKLSREGLFSQERKKRLPPFPERIGIVTSPTGAALQDMLSILGRRFPLAEIFLFPVLVQGEMASGQIAEAVERANRQKAVDVLVVGRGGGSLEDLWAFNEERVVRAVAASHIPVVSAVGHETDFTLCDFAADLRAPTPSAAAELMVPDGKDLLLELQSVKKHMEDLMERRIQNHRQQVDSAVQRASLFKFTDFFEKYKKELSQWQHRLTLSAENALLRAKSELAKEGEKLNTLSPLAVLSRGFILAENEEGALYKKAKDVPSGGRIQLRFSDGVVVCREESTSLGPVSFEKKTKRNGISKSSKERGVKCCTLEEESVYKTEKEEE